MEKTIQELQRELQVLRDQIKQQSKQPAQVVNLKPERPPPYGGQRTESLEAWIFQMNMYCKLLPVPLANRVPFAATFFKEHAAIWWRSIHEELSAQPEDHQWSLFIDQLRLQFQPIHTTQTARRRLDQMRQKTSVRLYNSEFRELMLQLPTMDEPDRLHAYIKGLKPSIATLVAMQQPKTLLAAQGLADTADAIQFQYQSPRRTYFENNRPYRNNDLGSVPMEVDVINKLTDAERERLRREGRCFRCRRPGHLSSQCPLGRQRSSSASVTRIQVMGEPDDAMSEKVNSP
jgi:hypothetical protein